MKIKFKVVHGLENDKPFIIVDKYRVSIHMNAIRSSSHVP
jgi:hypothetical protein